MTPPAKPIVDPVVDKLWSLGAIVYRIPLLRTWSKFNISKMQTWSEAKLERMLTGDAWRDNLIINKYEFAKGKTRLKSYPWRFSVPFVLCNARCEFCSAWLVQGEPMPLDLLDRLDVVLPYLMEINMVGWGEPLIHPQFGYILDKLKAKADRRARIDLTTNGVHLEKWTDRLIEANVRDFAISIHAATPETHRDLMGLPEDAFEKVLAGVRKLVAKRKWFSKMLGKLRIYRGINVSLVFIVTKQNLAEIPDFITLAEELKVDNIFFRTLKARTLEEQKSDGLDYQRLPPYLHPQFEELRARAVKAISRTRVRINAAPDTWSIGIFPKEVEAEILKSPLTPREVKRASKSYRHAVQRDSETLPIGEPDGSGAPRVLETMENPYNRTYPFLCPSPYTALYINGFDRQVTPCCYMGTIPGHKPVYLRKGASFDDVWNSPAMIELRRSLHEGPLKQPCLKCAFYW